MTRGSVLGAVLAAGAMSIGVGAYQAGGGQPQERVVKVERLKDNLFMLMGGGGNTAVFVQAKGVTVVDTKNPGWGQPILDKIKELTDKPVTTIINTHSHGDHVSGNVEFPATVEVIVHENTKTNMTKMASPPGINKPDAPPAPNIFEQNAGRGTARRTFKDRLTLGKGADQVDLYYFGRGHTNGDTMIVFPALRVMHMGDLFPGKQIPIMDANNGGSGVDYAATLKRTHDRVTGVDAIITGHSTVMTRQDLLEFSQFIGELVDAARAGKKAGQTPEQIAAAWTVPAKYTGYGKVDPNRLRLNIELIFAELK
jgi:glyoxylase-like metal-dependent hydrolase (beta-lactamase superfamily II)